MLTASVAFQAGSARVQVKNTFLDDWEDDDYITERKMNSRAFRTCPDLMRPEEPDAELSPDDAETDWRHKSCAETGILVLADAPSAYLSGLCPSSPRSCVDLGPGDKHYAECPLPQQVLAESIVIDEVLEHDVDPVKRRGGRGRASRKGKSTALVVHKTSSPTNVQLDVNFGCRGDVQKKERPRRAGSNSTRLWCNFYINEDMQRRGFELNKKIIGHGGQGTKRIFDATGAKIRLRGHGSGHLEGTREAPVHLMLSVTAELGEYDNFRKAYDMASELLQSVESRFNAFCQKNQEFPVQGPCFWVGEISPESQACVDGELDAAKRRNGRGVATCAR